MSTAVSALVFVFACAFMGVCVCITPRARFVDVSECSGAQAHVDLCCRQSERRISALLWKGGCFERRMGGGGGGGGASKAALQRDG